MSGCVEVSFFSKVWVEGEPFLKSVFHVEWNGQMRLKILQKKKPNNNSFPELFTFFKKMHRAYGKEFPASPIY